MNADSRIKCSLFELPFCGLEHEVSGKAFQIALNALHQDARLDFVERR